MNTKEINELCQKSAETYLAFLNAHENKNGVDIVYVTKVEQSFPHGTFILYLGKKLKPSFLQSIHFLIDEEKYYSGEDILLKQYKDSELSLKVKVKNQKLYNLFLNFPKTKIKIISDLKFLVQRVAEWYKKNNLDFFIPTETNSIPFTPTFFKEDLYPKKTQIEAINLILFGYLNKNQIDGCGERALSYIWGAPGTGKTQVVMAYSVIHYLRLSNSNRKILLTAPTNAALDQMLYGFIDALPDNEKYLMENVARLGMPTSNFLENYPQLCAENTNKKILACTLDYYIAQNLGKICSFEHIFLDEAGYTSLIKVIPLFTNFCPITLFGDHKQLKPICEMDEKDIKNKYNEVFLWGQSAINVTDVFLLTEEKAFEKYENYDPCFEEFSDDKNPMRTVFLKETYRFGSELSEILDKHIYKNEFHSSILNKKTGIYYINAVHTEAREDRSNKTEVEVISNFLNNINNADNKELAVLTPYRKQEQLIKRKIRLLAQNEAVYTTHASQGKEWDTVIFSVADNNKLSNRIYFTDSLNKKCGGPNLVNTTVSRAKNNLIIVCDYEQWINMDNQLISDLLKIAKEIKLDDPTTYPKIKDIVQEETLPETQVETVTEQKKAIDPYEYLNCMPVYPQKKEKQWGKIIGIIAVIIFIVWLFIPNITPKNTVYTTKYGKKYHKENCETIANSYKQKTTLEKAEKSGKTPCSVCNP